MEWKKDPIQNRYECEDETGERYWRYWVSYGQTRKKLMHYCTPLEACLGIVCSNNRCDKCGEEFPAILELSLLLETGHKISRV